MSVHREKEFTAAERHERLAAAVRAKSPGAFIPSLAGIPVTPETKRLRDEIGAYLTSVVLVAHKPRELRGKPKFYIGEHPGGHPYGEGGA